MSGGKTPEHEARKQSGRRVRVVKAVLQKQRIHVGAHDQGDGSCGFVQRRLALEVSGLAALLQHTRSNVWIRPS